MRDKICAGIGKGESIPPYASFLFLWPIRKIFIILHAFSATTNRVSFSWSWTNDNNPEPMRIWRHGPHRYGKNIIVSPKIFYLQQRNRRYRQILARCPNHVHNVNDLYFGAMSYEKWNNWCFMERFRTEHVNSYWFASLRMYPSPWACVHWLVQCTRTWMPLVDPVYIRIPLDDRASIAGCTGTSQEELKWNCHSLECHWKNSDYCSLHQNTTWWANTPPPQTHTHTHTGTYIVKQSSSHTSLKWKNDGAPKSKWTDLCKFSFYLEFTALQCIPVLLFKRVGTSTYEHHYSFV